MNSMQCAVENFVKAKKNGLCLIDMPTGTGKTYLTRKIIGAYIRGEILQDVENVFYLTTQKKNVDDIFNELSDDFKDNLELFDKNVLRIHANYECVLDKFLDVFDKMPASLKNKQSSKDLKKQIEFFNEMKKSNVPKNLSEGALMEIRKHYEVDFRKDLSEMWKKIAKTKSERLKKLNGDYSWVKELYPASLTSFRKVLFMTVDKFISGNDPIISNSYRFISNSKIKSALIFIDEFDATKDVLLNHEMQRCSDYKMDLIKLFSCISNTLKGREFPTAIFADSLDENDANSSISRFNKMKRHFMDVEKKYQLNYLFKLDSKETNDRYFLFDDYKLHTITNSKTDKNIILKTDKKKKHNIITLSKQSDEGFFYRTIYSIKNAINMFVGCCSKMALNYMNHYNDEAREKHKDMMEIDQAVSTIIDPYNLDYAMSQNLINMIVDNVAIPVLDRGIDVFDTDFYMNGFRYYDFKDDMSHDVSTAMAMSYLDNTPEKFMLSLSSKARVVGMSATASIETVTGNYDIDYLKSRLNEDYYQLPEIDRQSIVTYIKRRLSRESNIFVHAEEIDSENSVEEIVGQLFRNTDNIELYSGKFENYQQDRQDPYYHVKRTIKSLKAVRQFLENNSSKVMLVMTNRNVTDSHSVNIFAKPIIDNIIDSLCKEIGVNLPKVYYLNSAEFSSLKENYLQDIKGGFKVVLFSSYNTAGTGQNLQYEIDDREMDIDSLYLERPTNILVNDFKEESGLVKFIYQNEVLKLRGEIDKNTALYNIKSAFAAFMSAPYRKEQFVSSAYNTNTVNNHIVKVLIQAVGRICRAENKNENINIYVDEDIYNKVNFSVAYQNGRILNPEFQKVAEKGMKKINNDEIHIKLNIACEKNARVKTRIENMLNENRVSWSDSAVQQWIEMRKIVLKHPTISKEDLAEVAKQFYSIKDFYLEARDGEKIGHYLYVNDESETKQIFYDYDREKLKSAVLINEYNSRLTNLMRIPVVKSEFVRNGYATSFSKNDCIILPVVYQNIYKGAVGETAGRAILEANGIELKEITDATKFEKFDFCLARDNDTYVDFKNWSENSKFNQETYRNKCYEKLTKINGKKVFVINVVADDFSMHKSYDGKVIEISSLCKHTTNDNLYQLDRSDMNKVTKLFLEDFNYGNN